MNLDIRLAVGFWQHPKVRKLEKRLGLKGVRSLQVLWCWCAQNRPNGQLTGMDAEDIELAADWRGKESAFFEQCLGVWIDEVDGVYQLHEWEVHNPWQVAISEKTEAYREKKRKAAMARWGNRAGAHMQNNADAMHNDADAYADDAGCNADAMQAHMQNNADAMHNDATLTLTLTKEFKGNLNTSPPNPPRGEAGRDAGKIPDSSSPPEEPGMEFTQLRADWDAQMRPEGPLAGFKAYQALKKARAWPGLAAIRGDMQKRKQAGVWNPGYEPGLEKYLAERVWLAPPPKARADPKPRREMTLAEKNMDTVRQVLAEMELEEREAQDANV